MQPPENNNPDSKQNDDSHNVHRQNMVSFVFIALLILLCIWLVDGYGEFIKKEKCIEARRRNCDQIDLHSQ